MIRRAETPYFDRITGSGVRAEGLIPGYPSKTFPNHYSLATGLYPGDHGIVDNAFYDPALDAAYRLGDTAAVRDGRWYGGEPIWVTAERQGVRTASYFWVGSEAEINGVRPTYYKLYDGSVPYEARVDTVLHWLSLPIAERPRLVMLYFDEPDHIAHMAGPDAPAVDSMVARADTILGRLVEGLDTLAVGPRVTLILVSDHGMAPVPSERVIFLDEALDLEGLQYINNTTQAFFYLDGDTARARRLRDSANERLEHATAVLPGDMPDRLHYGGSRRVGDLVVIAEPGFVLRLSESRAWTGGGTHGWDPAFRPMHGIFLARGPRLLANRVIPAFENVHVHPLVAELLGIGPADDIAGRLEALAPVLRAPAPAAPARR
jgi:predicted AlkP superfamily pyrophosphatase or phosphodiesterase